MAYEIFSKLFSLSYYRNKIVVTFSLVTILLVIVLAKVSYDFIYDLYLEQLSMNVTQATKLTVNQIDNEYLAILNSSIVTESTKTYFNEFISQEVFNEIYFELFIFNKNLNVVVHSDSNRLLNVPEPRLLLNQNEIYELESGSSITSLPFKGNDNKWYLWSFHRFSDDYWLAIRASASRFESIDNLSKIIWLFGILGLIMATISGFVVANSITKPISNLVSFSTSIGKGNLKAAIPENMKGELKILSDALVVMRKNIADNQKEKENILAQIAHEIRNPLGGIELLTNLINETLGNDSKNKEYTSKILEEISGLKDLITSYLNYSRPAKVEERKINLAEVIDESMAMFEEELKEKNIIVKSNLKLEEISFDRNHFRNIIINLLKNSIESMNENGEIDITSSEKSNMRIITFSDNGPGIAEENLDKIFNPFFTTKVNGTGLGLASCKKYCEENSAQLTVKRLKRGCVFSIIKKIGYE